MSTNKTHLPDTLLLTIIVTLIVVGLFAFLSASFGLLTRNGAGWQSVIFSQLGFGLAGGLIMGLLAYSIPLQYIRRYALYIFILAILVCLLVFVPGIGMKAGGASRWIVLWGISFQPSEFLKLALVIFISTWAIAAGEEIKSIRYGLLPFIGIISVICIIMLAQPDTGTLLVMFMTSLSLFMIAGGKIKHVIALLGIAILLLGVLALARPYVRERIRTFIDPSHDPLGSSYQVRQSLIAIGSGGATGRGFGKSLQKFQYLPEPIGDSIYSVLSEEFGFLGSSVILLLFLSLFLRGLHVSARAPTRFHRLLGSGIAIMITAQVFLNIGAMVGIIPITGITLPLISHGGTALMFTLASLGLLLQISRYKIVNKV